MNVTGAPMLNGPPVEYRNVPGGTPGTAATIEAMKQLAVQGSRHPEIVALARSIVSGVRNKDYQGEVTALYWWVKRHVRYVQDPRTTEWVQHPHYTLLVSGDGDCDDHGVVLAALGLALGHAAAFRTVAADPQRPEEYSHVYAMLGFRDRQGAWWVPVDTTVAEASPGWEPPASRVFGVRDWVIAAP